MTYFHHGSDKVKNQQNRIISHREVIRFCRFQPIPPRLKRIFILFIFKILLSLYPKTNGHERKNHYISRICRSGSTVPELQPHGYCPLVQRLHLTISTFFFARTRIYNLQTRLFTRHEGGTMFTILLIMFFGIGMGYLFKNIPLLQQTEKSISVTIIALLFILGLSVGSNKLIIQNFGTFGWQAAVLATSSLLGSIITSWVVYRLFFKKGGKA